MLEWLKKKENQTSATENFSSLIKDYLNQAKKVESYWDIKPKDLVAGRTMIALSPQQHTVLLVQLLKQYIKEFRRIGSSYSIGDLNITQALQMIISQLLRRKLPYQDADLIALLKMANASWNTFGWYRPHKAILGAIERHYKDNKIPEKLITHLKDVRKFSRGGLFSYAEDTELYDRVNMILGEKKQSALKPDFNWSKNMRTDIDGLAAEQHQHWSKLIEHAVSAKASRPTKKWLNEAKQHIDAIGEKEIIEKVVYWFKLLRDEKFDAMPLKDNTNNTIVKGLVWITMQLPVEQIAREVKLLAIYSFRKIPDVGAVSTRVGNACLHVLGQLPGLDSVSMLNELMQKIKYPSARRLIEKALDSAAANNNMSREDLEELSVPHFGLNKKGQLKECIDDVTAFTMIEQAQRVQLLWQKKEGKEQKSIPAHIKKTHVTEIKELKKTVKDIQATLQSQTWRIEKLFFKERQWKFSEWIQRYMQHPLLQHVTHKLIWSLDEDMNKLSVMMLNGKLVDFNGKPIETNDDSVTVKLWHPVLHSAEEVMNWREFLYEHEITQPFKQAHREVYILTDAERQTEMYSNRFAAHVLKQHQLNALCQQRGWQYYLQGNFDSANSPTLNLPQHDLSVEFWLDGVETSVNDMGIFNYVSSDQVRFIRNAELLPLDTIETRLFSEVMRDVDLFVGVCSIGNDPGWQDGGLLPDFNNYWQEYSFGELGANAQIRKEVLEKLIPRLKIAEQCKVRGRFLVVKGKLRTYKIHLGSANILMEPNDQYLCIVEGRNKKQGDSGKLFLPFEGDHRLAVILSKAFMLAADEKISDRTIISQIKRN